MEKFPFMVKIDFQQDTTGIVEQIVTIKKVFKQLEDEVRKLDALINPTNIEIDIESEDK